MCFGGSSSSAPEVDDTPQRMQEDAAAEARAREEARQARVQTGRSLLDAMFEGGTFAEPVSYARAENLNPDADYGEADWQVVGGRDAGFGEMQTFEGMQPYLDDRRETMFNFHMPQLDRQAQDAQDDLTFAHARSGTLQSSMAGDNVGDLMNDIDMQRMSLLSDIDQDIAQTRGRFADTRMNLENMLHSTGDAEMTMNAATSQLNNLYSDPPPTSRLGDMFANTAAGIGQFGQGYNQGRVAGIFGQPSIANQAVPGGAGNQSSGRIVR